MKKACNSKLIKMYLFNFAGLKSTYEFINTFKYFETRESAVAFKERYFKSHAITKSHISEGLGKYSIKEVEMLKRGNKLFKLVPLNKARLGKI